ncbi:MAG: hypothetical protein H6901_10910 [Rhodobacteraceae bacterium]|nr:hypothetical protein [Paracoccaceae bacterium]MCP5342714.1 hypothetical protein [Paracoccaceae bacterium]
MTKGRARTALIRPTPVCAGGASAGVAPQGHGAWRRVKAPNRHDPAAIAARVGFLAMHDGSGIARYALTIH